MASLSFKSFAAHLKSICDGTVWSPGNFALRIVCCAAACRLSQVAAACSNLRHGCLC